MKKINLMFFAAVFVVIIALGSSLAQGGAVNTAGALFYQGNIYYQEGKYDAAIDAYEKLLGQGLESGNLYYNLGNSYFKKGALGLAVLNYEKAKGFIPNDSDLRANYDYTLQVLNLEPRLFGGWFEKTIYKLFEGMTIDALTIFLSFVYIVLIVFFILSMFFSRLKRFSALAACVLITLFILSAYALNRRINYLNKFAVVISSETDAKFEPLEGATTYFKLSEGSKVEVMEKAEGWYKIRRFDNKLGWVNKGALKQISEN
jgi:tetratricopeptide (TPR) repeat protein